MGNKKDKIQVPDTGKKTLKNWLYIAAILLLTLLIYSNSVTNDFIYQLDDDLYITNNKDIKEISGENLRKIFTESYVGLYLPLTMLTYMIEYHFFEMDASGYHKINLILHLINTVLIFFLFLKIKPKPIIAGVVALFFAIHPMHVESVSWISERKDVLYALFFLTGLIFYLDYLKKNTVANYLLAVLFFVFSLLSKAVAVSFPLFLVLFDWYQGRKFDKKVILEKVPFFALSLVFGLIGLYFTKSAHVNDTSTPDVSWLNRIFFVSDALVFYLNKVVAPFNLMVYKYYPANSTGVIPAKFYFSAIIFAAMAAITGYWLYKSVTRRREYIFGILFFAIPTFFVLQIIPAGRAYAADRYTYLSYSGLFFIAGLLADRAITENSLFAKKAKSIILILLAVFTAGFSYLTFERNKLWKDSLTMFTDLIEKNPDRGHPYLIRGITKYQFGEYKGALEDYNTSLKYDTTDPKAWANRASTRGILKDYQGALEDANNALAIDPNFINGLNNRATARFYTGDYQGAFDDYTTAIAQDTNDPTFYERRTMVAQKLQNNEALVKDYTKLISLKPGNYTYYTSRGDAWLLLNEPQKAIDDYSTAIRLNPSFFKVLFSRGNAWFKLGKYQEALADYLKYAEKEAEPAMAIYNAGMCYLQMNDRQKACEQWQKASALGFQNAENMLVKYCR